MTLRSALIYALLLAPLSASAAWEETWDFRASQVPGRWEVSGESQTNAGLEGLRVTTKSVIQMTRETFFTQSFDTVEFLMMSAQDTEMIFVWHRPGSPEDELVQLPVVIPRSGTARLTRVDLSHYKEWPGKPDKVGMRFPAGADVIVQRITFRGWNPIEKGIEAVRSMMIFDQYRPYTINFLWGPTMTINPVAREQIWDSQPPRGRSVNSVLYALLAIGCVTFGIVRMRSRRKLAATGLLALLTLIWIGYDIRMGVELLSYFQRDYRSYISQPPEDRSFRERTDVQPFMDAARPYIEGEDRFVLLTDYRYPFGGILRYAMYPAVPVYPNEQTEALIRTWLVHEHSNVRIENGTLLVNGEVMAQSGSVVFEWDANSFVYRIAP